MSAARPDIFISYAREDLEWVRPLAAELEARGWRVFWDQRIPAGKSWRSHIGVRLEAAGCVIVVWSDFALRSKFVLQEADIGLEREVLLPVLRQSVRPPLGFREVHAADLADWRPGEPSPKFETFIADLRELLAWSPAPGPFPVEQEPGSTATATPPAPPPRRAGGAQSPPSISEVGLPSGLKGRPARELTSVGGRGRSSAALVLALLAVAAVGAGLYAAYKPLLTPVPAAVKPPARPEPRRPTLADPTASALPAEPILPTGTLGTSADPGQPAPSLQTAASPPSESASRTMPLPAASELSERSPTPQIAAIPSPDATPEPQQPAPTQQAASALPVEKAPPNGSMATPAETVQPASAPQAAPTRSSEPAPQASVRATPEPPKLAPPPQAAGATPREPASQTSASPIESLSPADLEAKLGLSRDDWRALQRALAALGFDTGGADGKPGAMTRKAAARWQASKHLEATGYLGPLQPELIQAEARPKLAALDAATTLRSVATTSGAFPESVGAGPSSRKAGSVFKDCPDCPEMVVIPADSFIMGPAAGEEKYPDIQRKVELAQPFALGRYEVTFAQWDACVAAAGCDGYKPDDNGWGRGSHPVVNVSWFYAQKFLRWLSGQTGQAYRLPTEAEWEYAARGGTTTPFWTGASISPAQANYGGNRGRTVLVDDPTFPANSFGLFHMHGNVWEWVQDCIGRYQDAPTDGHQPTVRGDCRWRVLRGGSYGAEPEMIRSAKREGILPVAQAPFIGFRVARSLTS